MTDQTLPIKFPIRSVKVIGVHDIRDILTYKVSTRQGKTTATIALNNGGTIVIKYDSTGPLRGNIQLHNGAFLVECENGRAEIRPATV